MPGQLKLGGLSEAELARLLRGQGLYLQTGVFRFAIRSSFGDVAQAVRCLYSDHTVVAEEGFADFHVRVDAPPLRRRLRPQAQFYFDGQTPFKPLPRAQANAMLEWGMNWCITAHAHQYLILHAASLARDGMGLIMPAPPGSGKSTLAAALCFRGWRLLSDELTLLNPDNLRMAAVARPISLKNASIEIIRRFGEGAVLSDIVKDTSKGTVAHLRPPASSVAQALESAVPRWIVLPRYEAGTPACLSPVSPARAFMELAQNAFNYSLLGEAGFSALAQLVNGCSCYRFSYGDLEEAVALFGGLGA